MLTHHPAATLTTGQDLYNRDAELRELQEEVERLKEAVVFTHCNVCGIKLRTEDEEKMGMCERCSKE